MTVFGDLQFLPGGVSLAGARAPVQSELLCVTRKRMQMLMSDIPEMSDILGAVLVARRRRAVEQSDGGLRLIGREISHKVREVGGFAARNRIRHREVEAGLSEAHRMGAPC